MINSSHGHSFVLHNETTYTYMNDSLWSFTIDSHKSPFEFSLKWVSINTLDHPPFGVTNYGLGITEQGKIILHGGISKASILTRIFKSVVSYSGIWILNLMENVPNFRFIGCLKCGSGISKVISIGSEKIGILNMNVKNGMVIFEADILNVYNLIKPLEPLNREAFGVISINTTIVIIGGHGVENEEMEEIYPDILGFQLGLFSGNTTEMTSLTPITFFPESTSTYSTTTTTTTFKPTESTTILYDNHNLIFLNLLILPLVCGIIFIWKRKNLSFLNQKLKNNEKVCKNSRTNYRFKTNRRMCQQS